MAGRKENIKALFSNTRSRVIVILTVFLMLTTILVGYFKFKSPSLSNISGTSVSTGPGGIQSIPGAVNQTAQYAFLQEKQNIEQAKAAAKAGSSAIPTIVRSQGFGSGIEAVGPQGGKGELGFAALDREDTAGPQQSLWIQQLKESGCSKSSVAAVLGQGAGLSDLKTVCTCAQLRENGYKLNDLESVCSCPDLKAAGYNATQLKDAGYSAERLNNCGFNACELRAAGFTAQELKDAGLSDGELKGAGYLDSDIASASGLPSGVSAADILKDGCQADALKQLRAEGVTAAAIRRISGCSAAQLKAAGFTAAQLKAAGFTAAELKAAGFTAAQLKAAGFTAAQLKAAGFTAAQLKDAGFTPLQLTNVASNLVKRTGNCSITSLKMAQAKGESAAKIRETLGCSAAALKAAGYTAAQLKAAGFTAAELKAAGFTAAQLKAAGFSAAQLKAAGFTAAELKSAGFSAAQLKAAGFTAAELKAAGFSAAELKAAGLHEEAGISPQGSDSQGLNEMQTIPALTIPSLVTDQNKQSAQAAANEKQLSDILNQQKTHMAEQRYQQKIQQRTGLMTGAANQALQGWKAGFSQVFVSGPNLQKEQAAQSEVASNGKHSTVNGKVETGAGLPPVIHAGEVLFAVLDTSVNSDEPGPILATIVAGRFNGAKLIGSFSLPDNADKMVISFNMMSVPGAAKTTPINAYAIDPNTARTALSSRTDHHYLLRYGSLFASTFIEGFGNAFQSAGTTVTIGGTGVVQTTTVQSGVGRSVLENAVIGLATLGKGWGQVAMKQVNLPITVDVYSGTGLGILFTQDVASV